MVHETARKDHNLMGPKESIQQHGCPSCGVAPRQRCINVITRVVLSEPKFAKQHMCHIARVKLSEKLGQPIKHDNWPMTRLRA